MEEEHLAPLRFIMAASNAFMGVAPAIFAAKGEPHVPGRRHVVDIGRRRNVKAMPSFLLRALWCPRACFVWCGGGARPFWLCCVGGRRARPADTIKNGTFLRPRAPCSLSHPTSSHVQHPPTQPSITCICITSARGNGKSTQVIEIRRTPHRSRETTMRNDQLTAQPLAVTLYAYANNS